MALARRSLRPPIRSVCNAHAHAHTRVEKDNARVEFAAVGLSACLPSLLRPRPARAGVGRISPEPWDCLPYLPQAGFSSCRVETQGTRRLYTHARAVIHTASADGWQSYGRQAGMRARASRSPCSSAACDSDITDDVRTGTIDNGADGNGRRFSSAEAGSCAFLRPGFSRVPLCDGASRARQRCRCYSKHTSGRRAIIGATRRMLTGHSSSSRQSGCRGTHTHTQAHHYYYIPTYRLRDGRDGASCPVSSFSFMI